ncbi:MAG: hypothetical protein H0W02_14730 [Ktedonobacteraceae bacterium]|nr:hypothetical protein [Ktedonobacteraceae bacterium]
MRQQRVALLLLLLLAGLAACSPGHIGSSKIAFVRAGHLWTIYPDGTNPYEIVAGGPSVIGYGWSPSHQVLAFRVLDQGFAQTAAARRIVSNPISGLIGDLPSLLSTVGIDGGEPIPVMFANTAIRYSNAWWNPPGNRLLFRQTLAVAGSPGPDQVVWRVVQNDQPGGIASKTLPGSYAIFSLASNGLTTIGNSREGIFTTTLAGTDTHVIVHGPLSGHPLPAALERVLWQPAHADPAILYATTSPDQSQRFGATSIQAQLLLRDMHGHTTTLAQCACIQFAWSPDGDHVLYSTGTTYTIIDLHGGTVMTIEGEYGSIPYWSPDGRSLLLDGLHTLILASIASKQSHILLSDTSSPGSVHTVPAQPTVSALLQPALNSPWSADSRQVLFMTRQRLQWQGQPLSSGRGLYTVSLNDQGQPTGPPAVVDTGNDTQAGWTYEDANTSFLY